MKILKLYLLFILLMFGCLSCSTLRHEAERSIKKDVKQYMDENFKDYADAYHANKVKIYKDRLHWSLKLVSITVGIIGGVGGLVVLNRRIKSKSSK